jgi:inner membrane protein
MFGTFGRRASFPAPPGAGKQAVRSCAPATVSARGDAEPELLMSSNTVVAVGPRFPSPAGAMVPLLLLGVIFVLDAIWSATLAGSGALLNGIMDEPAHLATCGICLIALSAVTSRPLTTTFVVAALVGSTAIDLDHIPGFLGSHALSQGTSRPYGHTLLLLLVLVLLAVVCRGRTWRQTFLGLAFGVSTHLLRDTATGNGVPLLWPLTDGSAQIPYLLYAAILCGLVAITEVTRRRADGPARSPTGVRRT